LQRKLEAFLFFVSRKFIFILKEGDMVRDFVLKAGEKLTDVFVILSFVAVILVGIGASTETTNFGEGLLVFILVEIIGFIYVVVIFFFIYALIDIKNTLKKIEENTHNKS